MKKRIPALALALALLLTVPAHAAQDSTGNFIRFKTYTGQFPDVTADSVFYDNAAALYEYGLSVGKTDGTFGLRDNLTVGQLVIFAARIRSLYRTGDPEAGPETFRGGDDESTTARYLRYMQAEGVLGTELDSALGDTATRAQTAHVLANTLPEEALPPIHADMVTQAYASRQFITDVTEYTPLLSGYSGAVPHRCVHGQRRNRLLPAGSAPHPGRGGRHADADGGPVPAGDAGLGAGRELLERPGRHAGGPGAPGQLHPGPRLGGGAG